MNQRYQSFRPGREWLDTSGRPIQAHGGSIIHHDDAFYWYGENKEHTTPGSGIWHWGVRMYRSVDLYNWDDLGVVINPVEDDPASLLHPAQGVDRPHIVPGPDGGWVCWLKVMTKHGTQESVVLQADSLTGPWTMVRDGFRPLGMSAGDFDLVVDPHDGKAYYYYERVHSELICADLTEDRTDVTGYYSTHFPLVRPPHVREAPAYFHRDGRHYLVTSGTTGYMPNPSQVAWASTYHGPWEVLGDPHPDDASRTSFCSQVSSVFRHPLKEDLYIAVADRWLPGLINNPAYASGRLSAEALAFAAGLDPSAPTAPMLPESFDEDLIASLEDTDTSASRYVWLPISFEGEIPTIGWFDEWRIEDYA